MEGHGNKAEQMRILILPFINTMRVGKMLSCFFAFVSSSVKVRVIFPILNMGNLIG